MVLSKINLKSQVIINAQEKLSFMLVQIGQPDFCSKKFSFKQRTKLSRKYRRLLSASIPNWFKWQILPVEHSDMKPIVVSALLSFSHVEHSDMKPIVVSSLLSLLT